MVHACNVIHVLFIYHLFYYPRYWNVYSHRKQILNKFFIDVFGATLFWYLPPLLTHYVLTHWGRVMHICVVNLTIIGSDTGLSPEWRQAISKTSDGILSIGPLGTNFNEISIGIQTFSFKKMHFKMSSAKWRPFCLGLNVLIDVLNFDIGIAPEAFVGHRFTVDYVRRLGSVYSVK